ncbi:MAG TPA: ABC transporter [Firmicutes bacterium]|nr:ABC transporter [Bacillota bacterium]
MIRFENVSFSYADSLVLRNVSLEIPNHKFIGILGPNGGGKSTFLKLCLGFLKPSQGRIDRNISKISYVAQTTSLSDGGFPATVEEIVSLGLPRVFSLFHAKERKERVAKILEEFGLYPLRKRLIDELSGGQLQRVKIAKALIKNPDFVVLDEPDAGMDEQAHESLVSLIENLHKSGKGILFVSHHPEDLRNADAIYFIEGGQVLPYGEELERGHHHVDL